MIFFIILTTSCQMSQLAVIIIIMLTLLKADHGVILARKSTSPFVHILLMALHHK